MFYSNIGIREKSMIKQKRIGIGVDIGGSHIYSAAVDLTGNQLVPGSGFNVKINNQATADEILDGWANALNSTLSVISKEGIAGIGFAMPGPFDYPNGIALFERVEKYESLYGINVTGALRQRLGLNKEVPFRFMNDATAFAVAEAWIGQGLGFQNLIALTLGTGFGSAFIKDGIPVLSGESVPEMGCVWHLPYQNGIANDYFSTPWFTRKFFDQRGKLSEGVKELASMAESDRFVMDLFVEYGSNMGDFLAPWILKFNAEAIVIGGNITGAFHLFGPYLDASLKKNQVCSNVLISVLKEDAAVYGAARLLDDSFWLKIKTLLSLM